MREWMWAEWRRLRAPLLLVGLLHFLALAVVARFMSPLLWPAALLSGLAALYYLTGLLLAAWQWQAWLALPRWVGLLHQPLSPARCVAPLMLAAVSLLAFAVLLPLALALPVLAAFGHTVTPPHLGYPLLGALIALSAYLGGMAASLATGWGRWLVLLLPPMLWASLGARPLPELLGWGGLGCVLLGLLALGRVRPARELPPTGLAHRALELLLLLVPASWLLMASVQLLGQGVLLLLERHPAVHPAGPAHFEHWRASKAAERLAALWPAGGFEGWPTMPDGPPVLQQLYPGSDLPQRLAPGSESVAQLRLPDGVRIAHYDAQRQLYRLTDGRRRAQGWLGLGCPAALPAGLEGLSPGLPLPVPGGVMLGQRLLAWEGDCLAAKLDSPDGAPWISAFISRDGSLALSSTQLVWAAADRQTPSRWLLPRPLAPVQTLMLWRHPQQDGWLLMLLEGRFMQPAEARISLWSLREGAPPQALVQRPLAADFPAPILWSDTWPTPAAGILHKALGPPRPALPTPIVGLLVLCSALSAAAAMALCRRRGLRHWRQVLPWVLLAAATGPPALAPQQHMQRAAPRPR